MIAIIWYWIELKDDEKMIENCNKSQRNVRISERVLTFEEVNVVQLNKKVCFFEEMHYLLFLLQLLTTVDGIFFSSESRSGDESHRILLNYYFVLLVIGIIGCISLRKLISLQECHDRYINLNEFEFDLQCKWINQAYSINYLYIIILLKKSLKLSYYW